MAAFSSIALGVAAAGAVSSAISAKKQAKAAKTAATAQQAELDRQAEVRADQDKLVQEQKTTAKAEASERRKRLGTGRRGLLFGGDETGVTSGAKPKGLLTEEDELKKQSTLG